MTERSEMEQAIELYFRGINENNVDLMPLAEEVEFIGQMVPEPLRGERTVREHFANVAPFVERIECKRMVIDGNNVAVVLEFEGLNGVVIEGAEFFRLRDGLIYHDQVFFDTRPLIQGPS
jgi:hypothetical protein